MELLCTIKDFADLKWNNGDLKSTEAVVWTLVNFVIQYLSDIQSSVFEINTVWLWSGISQLCSVGLVDLMDLLSGIQEMWVCSELEILG